MKKLKSVLLSRGYEVKADGEKLLYACKAGCAVTVRIDYKGYSVEMLEQQEGSIVKKVRFHSVRANDAFWWIHTKLAKDNAYATQSEDRMNYVYEGEPA